MDRLVVLVRPVVDRPAGALVVAFLAGALVADFLAGAFFGAALPAAVLPVGAARPAGMVGALRTPAFLAGAFLAGAFFAGAFFAGAFVTAIFFAGAFLAGAFFAGAFLAGAFLAGAFFAGAFCAGAFLAGAFFVPPARSAAALPVAEVLLAAFFVADRTVDVAVPAFWAAAFLAALALVVRPLVEFRAEPLRAAADVLDPDVPPDALAVAAAVALGTALDTALVTAARCATGASASAVLSSGSGRTSFTTAGAAGVDTFAGMCASLTGMCVWSLNGYARHTSMRHAEPALTTERKVTTAIAR